MTLYTLNNDTAGVSTCNDTCASVWPPVLASANGMDMTGTFNAAFGSISRADGNVQVTYNGKPLYFFSHDAAPGDANGQGVTDQFGTWSVAAP